MLFVISSALFSQIEPIDTDANGYRNISNLENLRWVSEKDTLLIWHYELDNDIDASDTKNWNNGKGWNPIGDSLLMYKGNFKGNAHTISNLYINRPGERFVGFFGSQKSIVTELTLSDCDITGGVNVGGVAGYNDYQFIKCNVTGKITGDENVGGLIGRSYISIMNACSTNVVVHGNKNAGALCGLSYGSNRTQEANIISCQTKGSVNGTTNVGGLFGEQMVSAHGWTDSEGRPMESHTRVNIRACRTEVAVVGQENVSGFIGLALCEAHTETAHEGQYSTSASSWLAVDSCAVHGTVEAKKNAGSFCGEYITNTSCNSSMSDQTAYTTIKNSYSLADIDAEENVGGFCGIYTEQGDPIQSHHPISFYNCYYAGNMTAQTSFGAMIGGEFFCMAEYSFYDIEKIPENGSANGAGYAVAKSTADMKTKSTYTDAGWDFDTIWDIDGVLNDGYPFLRFEKIIPQKGIKPTDTDGNGYYNISTLDHLRWISENNTSWDWDFELDNDIDASDTKKWNVGDHDNDTTTPDSAMGWKPIGYLHGTAFTGQFNGNNHAIRNLYINRRNTWDPAGFIAMAYRAKIENLGIENCNIFGGYEYIGGLSGRFGMGSIINCYSTGSIIATDDGHYNIVGGLVGEHSGSLEEFSIISGCSSLVKVHGYGVLGGLVGVNTNAAVIDDCSASGNVSGIAVLGGLVGINNTSSQITNSFATGNVSGEVRVGGFIGENNNNILADVAARCSSISNCYATGDVTGKSDVGGFVGSNSRSIIAYSYSAGKVQGEENVGGFTRYHSNYIYNCFWDKQTSQIDSSASGTGLTTEEMKKKLTFVEAGWNCNYLWKVDANKNNGYPYLELNPMPITESSEPLDTDNNGWRNITSLANLVWMSENSSCWADSFELDNDIDASSTIAWEGGLGFSAIGNDSIPFTGIFDGNNHKISHLYANHWEDVYVGLFGVCDSAEIKNVGIVDCDLLGHLGTGALVAVANNSTITNCFSTGVVRGISKGYWTNYKNVGGLVGRNNNGKISRCYAKICVLGETFMGGIVGSNYGVVEQSFSEGAVLGSYYSGGIAGYNYESIIDCYSFCTISCFEYHGGGITGANDGRIKNCYSIDGITGSYKDSPENCFDLDRNSMEEMKTKSTYTNAGWDFETIWDIDGITNDGYPFFKEWASSVEEEYIANENNVLYPNPANDILNIRIQGNPAIKIYDLTGTEVLSASGSQINIEKLSRGMYFVLILQNGEVKREVFVKE